MCGIVGIIDPFSLPDQARIVKMRDIFVYRGPDDCGSIILEDGKVSFGHRRLSILDLSSSGRQPMTYGAESLHIVFNGEIFNYLEIREDLKKAGYAFETGTDTEVLLKAYDCWGAQCLDRFIGMFAFAIWNGKSKELFMARDRLGIKPLYYAQDGKRFLFASEAKAILSMIEKRPTVDPALIDLYMSFGYVPGGQTLHKGIERLLPGHYLILRESGLELRQYWDLQFVQNADLGMDYYLSRLQELLTHAIELRLRTDVPLGIFLSGGLDSSAVVAMLAPRVGSRLKTFSVAYDFGHDFNETPYARQVAARFNTEHHEFFISPSQFRDFIPKYVEYMDEPVTESAAISLYFISVMAKDYVTVVLSGEGSDELFAGYSFYIYNQVIENARRLLGNDLSALLSSVPMIRSFPSKLAKYTRMLRYGLEDRYKGISTYEESRKEDLYSKEFLPVRRTQSRAKQYLADLFQKTTQCDPLSRMLYFDTKTWLVDDLLIKADRMSMAASLELRVPFLDHRLVEFAASVPSKYKIMGTKTKYLLKELMKDQLPENIVKRKKMGFPTPLEIMFRGDLYGYAADILLSKSSIERGYFREDALRKLLEEHKSGKAAHHKTIWQLVVLEEWHRHFV